MKTALAVFIVLLLLHLIAAVGFVGWLGATDRIDGQRLRTVASVFEPTLAEEARAKAEAEAAAEEARAARDQLMRLDGLGDGPQSIEDRLAENFEADEFDLHRLERLNAETEAIRRRLDQDKKLIAEEMALLEQHKAEFAALVERRTQAMEDEDFRRAVKTLEQLPPKQAKQMIQQYLAAGQLDEAVDYLAAMQLRKSAGVLKAFKAEEDIPQAAMLLDELRKRGQDPFGQADAGAAEPSAAGGGDS
ncbi:MAG: hypothetical protein AAF710_10695 [Planctomycetota bacterium]